MPDTVTFLSIDDDPLGIMSINELAAHYPWLKLKGNFSNAGDGIAAITATKPDLVFMDIEMPLMSGIDILRKVKDKILMAVFVTSHPEFALDGFELSALDYLLKPVEEERFAQTMQRVQEYWQMKQKAGAYEIQMEKEKDALLNEKLTEAIDQNLLSMSQKDILSK